jgi:hypothetical protein
LQIRHPIFANFHLLAENIRKMIKTDIGVRGKSGQEGFKRPRKTMIFRKWGLMCGRGYKMGFLRQI